MKRTRTMSLLASFACIGFAALTAHAQSTDCNAALAGDYVVSAGLTPGKCLARALTPDEIDFIEEYIADWIHLEFSLDLDGCGYSGYAEFGGQSGPVDPGTWKFKNGKLTLRGNGGVAESAKISRNASQFSTPLRMLFPDAQNRLRQAAGSDLDVLVRECGSVNAVVRSIELRWRRISGPPPAPDPTPDPEIDLTALDFNDDGTTDHEDFRVLLMAYGPCSSPCDMDFNDDAFINADDVAGWLGLYRSSQSIGKAEKKALNKAKKSAKKLGKTLQQQVATQTKVDQVEDELLAETKPKRQSKLSKKIAKLGSKLSKLQTKINAIIESAVSGLEE